MMLRMRLFHLWFRLSRPMTLGVRVVAQDEAGRVMLVRHSYVPGWHLPGGGVEAGEMAADVAKRELEEETGLICSSAPELISVHFNAKFHRDHVLLYRVLQTEQTRPHVADREILEARFFNLDNLPEGTTEATRARLAEVFEGRPPSPYW